MTGVEAPVRVRVLIVDDEEDLRVMLRLFLGIDPRFEIAGEACDGREAVECCTEVRPDLIVLDVRMPRLDGMAALPLLRELCPGVRVALFTAFAEIVDPDLVRAHDAIVFEKDAPLPWLADALYEFAQHN